MSAEVKLWRDEAIHYYLLIAIRVLSVYPTSNLLRNDHVDKKGRFYLKNCNSGCTFADIYIEFITISILLSILQVHK